MNEKKSRQSFFRKALSGVLAVLVALSFMPAGSQVVKADTKSYQGVAIGDYTYDVYDDGGGGSVWLMGYNRSGTELVLPISVTCGGVTFKAGNNGEYSLFKQAFSGNTKIQKIAIPDGYDIMRGAFAGCTNLTEVAIGNVYAIGMYDGGDGSSTVGVFAGCPNLKTYRINGDGLWPNETLVHSGIGQDLNGNIYPGVTVYTKKGSMVDQYIQDINKKSTNGNTIKLVYEDNPYSKHTVKPGGGESGSGSGNSSGSNSGSGSSSGSESGSGSSNSSGNGSGSATPADSTEQMGNDGTAFSPGASAAAAENAIINLKNDNDPKGTTFFQLQAKAKKTTKNSIKLKWNKAKGAKKYVVFANKCGKGKKYKKLTTTKKTALTIKKVAGKKLKKGTYYKFIIVALDSNGKVLATSKTIHAATKGGKAGNDKSVTITAKVDKNGKKISKAKALTSTIIKKGKSVTLTAKATAESKSLKVSRHRKVAFESSNPTIATVNKKGVVKAKKKGTCYIYAYAQNGVCKKIKITVK